MDCPLPEKAPTGPHEQATTDMCGAYQINLKTEKQAYFELGIIGILHRSADITSLSCILTSKQSLTCVVRTRETSRLKTSFTRTVHVWHTYTREVLKV